MKKYKHSNQIKDLQNRNGSLDFFVCFGFFPSIHGGIVSVAPQSFNACIIYQKTKAVDLFFSEGFLAVTCKTSQPHPVSHHFPSHKRQTRPISASSALQAGSAHDTQSPAVNWGLLQVVQACREG